MIELTPEQNQFVETQIATGNFKDPSEVIQAGIELLRKTSAQQEYDATVKEIQAALPDIEAGRGRPLEEADAAIRKKLGFSKSP